MTTVSEIPTIARAQRFTIELTDGVQYAWTLRWNQWTQAWFANVDKPDGTPVLDGIMLVTGVDLFSQFEHLGFGGALIVQTDNDSDAVPTLENLGTLGHLYFEQP